MSCLSWVLLIAGIWLLLFIVVILSLCFFSRGNAKWYKERERQQSDDRAD